MRPGMRLQTSRTVVRTLTLAIALALWTVPAWAIAIVQAVAAQGNSTAPSVTLTTTGGNAIIVVLMQNNSATPSQTAGDTVTSNFRWNDTGSTTTFLSNLNIAGGSTTYTFTITTSVWTIWGVEVSGLATTAAFDQSASTVQAAATTHSSGTTPTTTQASELCIAAFNGDGTGSSRTFSSWTNGFTTPTNGDQLTLTTGIVGIIGTNIVAATGTYETTLTTTALYTATGAIATYKGASAACTPSLMLLGVGRCSN